MSIRYSLGHGTSPSDIPSLLMLGYQPQIDVVWQAAFPEIDPKLISQWFHKTRLCETAVKLGHWHILLWMHRIQPAAEFLDLLNEVYQTSLECTRWLQGLSQSDRLPWMCTIAAEARSLHMLRSLRDLKIPWDSSLYDAACREGNLVMLKWVASQHSPPDWNLAHAREAPDIIAALGNVDLMSQIWPVQVGHCPIWAC